MKRIYLKPRSSYRTEPRSDTLFGCLCWAIREVHSEATLTGLLDRFGKGDPPFRISSAFPFRNTGDDRACFFPRPMLAPAALDTPTSVNEAARQKAFRKGRWVTEETFGRIVRGNWGEGDFYASGDWEVKGPTVRTEEVQHNSIDRLSGGTTPAGNLYSVTERTVIDGGLFFLMEGETDSLDGALGFLQHLGIGGDSSLGKGQFDIAVEDAALPEVADADRFVTLSLFAPRADETDALRSSEAWYELTTRKGKIGGPFLRVSDFWKATVPMFAEGSTFPLTGDGPFGHNPVVKAPAEDLPFAVQHYGYAFAVPMKTKVA